MTANSLISMTRPAILFFGIVAVAISACQAEEFRIETEVYIGSEKKPVSQNLTLFSDGMIYDFQLSDGGQPEPLEIAIYDSHDKSFVLLDINRKIRLRLHQVHLMQMVEGLRQQTSQNELTKFLLEDNFEEEFDVTAGLVSLKNAHFEYRLKGEQPSDVSILPAYFEFLDQYTRLNASDPTKLPPFPRLKLNQSIKKFGWIPTRVEVTLNENGLFPAKIEIRSEHTLFLSLSDKDRQRIKEAKSDWMAFKPVKLSTYRGLKVRPRFSKLMPGRKRGKTNKGVEDSANGGL